MIAFSTGFQESMQLIHFTQPFHRPHWGLVLSSQRNRLCNWATLHNHFIDSFGGLGTTSQSRSLWNWVWIMWWAFLATGAARRLTFYFLKGERVDATRISGLTLFKWPESANLGNLMRLWARPRVRISLACGFSMAIISVPTTPTNNALCLLIHPIARQSGRSKIAHPQFL